MPPFGVCVCKTGKHIVKKIVLTMAPTKKQEYSNDLRVVIKHFLNGDPDREIARKVLIPGTSVHYMITKYK